MKYSISLCNIAGAPFKQTTAEPEVEYDSQPFIPEAGDEVAMMHADVIGQVRSRMISLEPDGAINVTLYCLRLNPKDTDEENLLFTTDEAEQMEKAAATAPDDWPRLRRLRGGHESD